MTRTVTLPLTAADPASAGGPCLDDDDVLRLLDGELDVVARGAVEAHLDTCKACRKLVAAAAPQREPGEDGGLEAAPASLLPSGAKLARYVILDAVGSGGMGVVYAAYDPELDRRVAVKLLWAGAPGTDEARERRVLREAQAMARLTHPSVVAVYDVGLVGGQVFIVMEFVQGTTLTRWLTAEERPFRAVLDALRRAGLGLAAAHAAGLVHRDFKPDNVLIDRAGRVLVADFGLARAKGGGPSPADAPGSLVESRITRTGAVAGTPAYMAPEQFDGGEVDARSDVFSFCVTLYEALYGQRPFAGGTVKEIRAAISAGRTTEPTGRNRVPSWVRPIVMRGLHAAPADRVSSMDDLLAALGRDPSARLRRVLVGLALSLAVGVAALAVVVPRSGRALVCQGSARKLAGVWDEARRQEVESALVTGRGSWAQGTARLVRAALDRYTDAWVAMHTEACEATQVYHEQSEVLLDRRMRCLDQRLAEVRALTDLLRRPDDTLAESAARAPYSLSPLRGCADADALLAVVPLPADVSSRAAVEQLRLELAELRPLKLLKRFRDGEPQIQAILARVRPLGYAPLLAEALVLDADFIESHDDYPAAADLLREALWAAESGRDRKVAAAALIDLVWVVGVQQGQPRQAYEYARHAGAILRGLGGDTELEASLAEYYAAVLAGDEGDHLAEVEALFREAADKRRSLFGPAHPGVAAALENLAGITLAQGRKAEALALGEEALGIYRQSLGDRHPTYCSALFNLAEVLRDLGRLDEARERAEEALAHLEEALGPDRTLVADAANVVGRIALDQKRYADAERSLRRSIAITEKLRGPEHMVLVERLSSLAQALDAQHRGAEAVPLYRRALTLGEKAKVDPSELAATRAHLDATLLALEPPGSRGRGRGP